VLRTISAGFLGHALALAGRLGEARAVLDEGIEYGRSIRFMAFQPINFAWRADLDLRTGRRADAITDVEQALSLARRHGQPPAEGEALLIGAAIHASGETPDRVQAHAWTRAAASLANQLGMRPLAARCRLQLGQLSHLAGRADQAREHLAAARAMFSQMHMALLAGANRGGDDRARLTPTAARRTRAAAGASAGRRRVEDTCPGRA
jgi:tetratricopeptide (TPR) repeat protein